MRILFNERGAAHWVVFTLGWLIVFFIGSAIVFDYMYVVFMDSGFTAKLADINRNIYSLINVQYTAYHTGIQVDDYTAAYDLFSRLISETFGTHNNSVNGPVTIVKFEVVTESHLPFDDGHGRIMNNPGIVSELIVPVKTPLLGIETDKRILVTTEVFR